MCEPSYCGDKLVKSHVIKVFTIQFFLIKHIVYLDFDSDYDIRHNIFKIKCKFLAIGYINYEIVSFTKISKN
ncbi:MAG: hypothetical protein TECD_00010 [Hyphomicrobiaceae bacterium hypho_1]